MIGKIVSQHEEPLNRLIVKYNIIKIEDGIMALIILLTIIIPVSLAYLC